MRCRRTYHPVQGAGQAGEGGKEPCCQVAEADVDDDYEQDDQQCREDDDQGRGADDDAACSGAGAGAEYPPDDVCAVGVFDGGGAEEGSDRYEPVWEC